MRRKALVNMLDLIKPALADKPMVPVFQNFCFTGKRVYGYNDALGIVGKCTTERPFSVHGETLLGILRNSRTEEIEVSFEDAEVILKAGRTKARLPYLEEAEFVFEEPSDEKWEVEFSLTNDMMDTLNVCLMTSGKDNSLPALMGVVLNIGDGISFYSCDGDAITHYMTDATNDGDLTESSFVIPNEFVQAVLRIAGKDKSVNGVLKVNDDWALAELENGFTVYGRIIKPDDPLDHAAKITETLAGRDPVWLDIPKGMEHALSRACVVTTGESSPTSVKIKEGKMVLLSETSMGTVRDSLKIPEHPDVEATVNAALMARSIGVCTEMAVFPNCTAFRKGEALFQIITNLGG